MHKTARSPKRLLLIAGLSGVIVVAVSPAARWALSQVRAYQVRALGSLALVRASGAGDAAQVKALLQQGVPANSYHPEGSSALWWAVESGSLEAVELLLQNGADPNSRGQWDSVIDAAVRALDSSDGKPRRAIAEALLRRAPQIHDPNQVRLLKDALSKKPQPTRAP